MTTHERRAIADIRIGHRHRQDMGDLAELAESIKAEGLLQPIGILQDNTLVFGHRRLLACRDHLGWTEIDVRVVHVTSVVVGEMHENEMRKQFTASERVAIFRAIETVGRGGINQWVGLPRGEDPKIVGVDEAAKLAGFAGRGTAYRAETVVTQGAKELVQAMDSGAITITAAAEIARHPKADQPEKVRAAVDASRRRPQGGAAPKPKPKPKPKTQSKPKSASEGPLKIDHIVSYPPTLSDEEAGITPGMTFEEEAQHQEKYGKAQTVPKAVRDMQDHKAHVEDRVDSFALLVSSVHCDAATFTQAVEAMSAWRTDQRKPHYVGRGWETDYAKIAAKQLARLRELLPQARQLLDSFERALAERDRPKLTVVSMANTNSTAFAP